MTSRGEPLTPAWTPSEVPIWPTHCQQLSILEALESTIITIASLHDYFCFAALLTIYRTTSPLFVHVWRLICPPNNNWRFVPFLGFDKWQLESVFRRLSACAAGISLNCLFAKQFACVDIVIIFWSPLTFYLSTFFVLFSLSIKERCMRWMEIHIIFFGPLQSIHNIV